MLCVFPDTAMYAVFFKNYSKYRSINFGTVYINWSLEAQHGILAVCLAILHGPSCKGMFYVAICNK